MRRIANPIALLWRKDLRTRDSIWIEIAAWSRHRPVRAAISRLLPRGEYFDVTASCVKLLVAGDVCFDRERRGTAFVGVYSMTAQPPSPSLSRRVVGKLTNVLSRTWFDPNLFSRAHQHLPFQEVALPTPANANERQLEPYYHSTRQHRVEDHDIGASSYSYPFTKIGSFLKSKDVVFVNLETPLTTAKRQYGMFKSDPGYAEAMKAAGITVVSIANNHMFDAGEEGFLDTLGNLDKVGIVYSGGGRNITCARAGGVVEARGLLIRFLSYTQYCNSRFASVAAEYPGILPLDRQLVEQDIRRAKKEADFVFVSLHWGLENQPNVQPEQIHLAHFLVDAGADGIIGHHPHIAHAIEIYKAKPILYSLGNFVFGHSHKDWSDNLLIEIVIEDRSIKGLAVYPVAGASNNLFCPELLTHGLADALLHEVRMKSLPFGTGMALRDSVGYVKVG